MKLNYDSPFVDLVNAYIDAVEDDSLTSNQQDLILDDVETWIRQKVEPIPALLDAAQDMYDSLTALSAVSGEVLALCSSGLTVPRKVWESMIDATDKAIAVCKQAKGETR